MQSARPSISSKSFCIVMGGQMVVSGTGRGSVNNPVRSMREIVSNILSSPVLSTIGQVEGFVDKWKIRHDVAEDGVFNERPVLPGWIVRIATPDAAICTRFKSDHHRPPPSFDQADSHPIRLRNR